MIEKAVLLACAPERAFELFTEHASSWWPETRRHTPDPQSTIRMVRGGRFWERGRDGHEVELGRVRVWEAPSRLILDFYVGTDAAHPTEVTVTFSGEGDRTRVVVRHGPLPESEGVFGTRAPAYERSWATLLDALAKAAEGLSNR
jgi:uncharacterized protein YndB with AHSA1/START domain